MTPALLEALNHPVRRQLLRLLHERRAAQSPLEMSHDIALGLAHVSYHVRILSDLHVVRLTRTRPVRGSTQHFYLSRVLKNELVDAILRSTEKDDRFVRE
jgi:DNA-binding transcriptional ArsR family regulator